MKLLMNKKGEKMKKYMLLISLIALSACATSTDAGNGLARLDSEPKNCEFLYTLDSNVTTYKLYDAYDFLEKSIIEQNKQGDSYYIVSQNTVENPDAIFGPKNTFKFKAKVYNCEK